MGLLCSGIVVDQQQSTIPSSPSSPDSQTTRITSVLPRDSFRLKRKKNGDDDDLTILKTGCQWYQEYLTNLEANAVNKTNVSINKHGSGSLLPQPRYLSNTEGWKNGKEWHTQRITKHTFHIRFHQSVSLAFDIEKMNVADIRKRYRLNELFTCSECHH